MTKERKTYLDIIKIVASFGVVYNHTAGAIVDSSAGGKTYVLSLVIFFLSKTAVPLFLMVSAANLMRKEESVKVSFIRALRVSAALMLITIFYLVFYIKRLPTFAEYVNYVYTGEYAGILWYVYMYAGLMFMMPVIRCIKLDRKVFMYLLGLFLFFSAGLPYVSFYFFGGNMPSDYFTQTFFSSFLVCFLVGDFLDKEDSLYTKRNFIVAALVAVIDIVFSVFCVYREIGIRGVAYIGFVYDIYPLLTSFVLAVCVYFMIKYAAGNKSFAPWFKWVTTKWSGCVFGIYLVHLLFVFIFGTWFDALKLKYNVLLAILLFDAAVYLMSFAVVFVLKLIPGLRKIL